MTETAEAQSPPEEQIPLAASAPPPSPGTLTEEKDESIFASNDPIQLGGTKLFAFKLTEIGKRTYPGKELVVGDLLVMDKQVCDLVLGNFSELRLGGDLPGARPAEVHVEAEARRRAEALRVEERRQGLIPPMIPQRATPRVSKKNKVNTLPSCLGARNAQNGAIHRHEKGTT